MFLTLFVFRNGQNWVTGAPVQLLSLILGLSSAWWRIGSRRNIRLCCLSLQSSSLPPTLDALSMHVWRANYQAALWCRALHPGSSLPGPQGYGWLCKPECGDDPASHSSVEIQWMTRPAATQAFKLLDLVKCAVAHRVAPHSVVDAAKDILTEMKFVSAQTARISHTSKHHSLHTMTKRLMVTHDLILHNCIVLYFFNSSAGNSQLELIIAVFSIITCSTTFNHIFSICT